MRAPNLMWFLGAGASASAGIPTAGDMIWEFKQRIYCSEQHVSPAHLPNLADLVTRERLQAYFDGKGTCPPGNSVDEYSYYFEACYPSEADRRNYLETRLLDAAPQFGHLVLAALMATDRTKVVWTTNFDRTIEDAVAQVRGGTGYLNATSSESLSVAQRCFRDNKYPVLVKLHGDFQYDKLKNTATELQTQDTGLRELLVKASERFGLIVAGYSGRDESIMSALMDAIHRGGFRGGLYWLSRDHRANHPQVSELIREASRAGIDAELVDCWTFEELMSVIWDQSASFPREIHQTVEQKIPSLRPFPLVREKGNLPVLRLNALPVELPRACIDVTCVPPEAKELRERVKVFDGKIAAYRGSKSVLAYGTDDDIRKLLNGCEPLALADYPISLESVEARTGLRGLMSDVIINTLGQTCELMIRQRGRDRTLTVGPQASMSCISAIGRVSQGTSGRIPATEVDWEEGLKIHVDIRFDHAWLLLEPFIWTSQPLLESREPKACEFVRLRQYWRRNKVWDALLDGWIKLIVPVGDSRTFTCVGCADRDGFTFTLHSRTAASYRAK